MNLVGNKINYIYEVSFTRKDNKIKYGDSNTLMKSSGLKKKKTR